MNRTTKLITGLLVIFLVAAQSATPNSRAETRQRSQAVVMLTPCALPTADITSRLPWFIRASDVICMSVTAEDLQASERVGALLIDVGGRLQEQSSFSHLKTEYDRAMTAYGDGNYAEAISRLQAATASGKGP
jgi:hypothetical protein